MVVALSEGKKTVATLRKAFNDARPFDLCILDIRMPEIGGCDVAREVRNLKSELKALPLLALSSQMDHHAGNCEDAGFNGFLSKPVRRRNLYLMLERLLGVKKNESEDGREVRLKIATQYSVQEDIKHSVRVLLAEDNVISQTFAEAVLTKAGYKVEIANNGKEAVDKYTASPESFDLIFMDIQMPVMDGIAATLAIRNKGFNTVPIIALTANAMKGDRERCLEAGMNDYTTKPVKREIVYKMSEKWIFNRDV